MPFNLGPVDVALQVTQALPAAGQSVTTGTLDLQNVALSSDAWRLGRFLVSIPALPENTTGAGITFTLYAAAPALTGAGIAPAQPVPAAFAQPICTQVVTLSAVAGLGSAATNAYFTMAFDVNGSTLQFYQFVISTPAQVTTQGEVVTISFVYA